MISASGSLRSGRLYENFYCARGDMENRIKEQNGSVCRSHQHPLDGFQPIAALVLGLCASDHEHSASQSFKGYRTGSGFDRPDPFATL